MCCMKPLILPFPKTFLNTIHYQQYKVSFIKINNILLIESTIDYAIQEQPLIRDIKETVQHPLCL